VGSSGVSSGAPYNEVYSAWTSSTSRSTSRCVYRTCLISNYVLVEVPQLSLAAKNGMRLLMECPRLMEAPMVMTQ
jgi:hypothetical protein